MCTTCGCSDDAGTRISALDGTAHEPSSESVNGAGHSHPHPHEHPQGHEPADKTGHKETISLEQNLLAKNELLAARNRGWLEGRGVRALNLMSSPGAGKTTLLVRTIADLAADLDIAVIEGDQETSLDADRIRAANSPVIQINTGAGCHLDADMLGRALTALDPRAGATVFIENVGNLVCPALFDLGEAAKVVIISVTEGDDKPHKYPHMFMAADLVVINKSDLLPYVDFDVVRFSERARQLNPQVQILVLSAVTGDGLDGWYAWLIDSADAARVSGASHSRAATVPS